MFFIGQELRNGLYVYSELFEKSWTVCSQVGFFSAVPTVNREPINSWIKEEIISGREIQMFNFNDERFSFFLEDC